MKIGIRRAIRRLYYVWVLCRFGMVRFIFGTASASRLLRSIDKSAVVGLLRRHGAQIGERCDIETPVLLHNCPRDFSNLRIGNDCHIGKGVFIDLKALVTIEDAVTVSMRTTIITHSDVGASPLREKGFVEKSGNVSIRKGAYIGACAVILSGVTVGECAVVGAGAVVAADVADCSVVGGVPAKTIRKIENRVSDRLAE